MRYAAIANMDNTYLKNTMFTVRKKSMCEKFRVPKALSGYKSAKNE